MLTCTPRTSRPASVDPWRPWTETEDVLADWAGALHLRRPLADAVVRSLITLKALTYTDRRHRGGATTSLPEDIGGVRNWDYRYCWLRDATFTL